MPEIHCLAVEDGSQGNWLPDIKPSMALGQLCEMWVEAACLHDLACVLNTETTIIEARQIF